MALVAYLHCVCVNLSQVFVCECVRPPAPHPQLPYIFYLQMQTLPYQILRPIFHMCLMNILDNSFQIEC